MDKSLVNFGPGPTKLPAEVLKKIQDELIFYQDAGLSILEMSHRSSQFTKIIEETESNFRELMDIPTNYKILFLQGGATGEFAAIPLNLINRKPSKSADYVVTGIWSTKAVSEAAKYGNVREVFPRMKSFSNIPDRSSWELDSNASYIYYCSNETVHGVEFKDVIDSLPDIPIVCDMSSNILSKQIQVSKFGLIFASAQKNLGCAGLTVVIVREDLLHFALPQTPTVFNFKLQSENNSLYNTPPVFSIYISNLILKWMKDQGGSKAIENINLEKATLLYKCIDESDGFYKCPVNAKYRSLSNVVFRIKDGNEDAENAFVAFAKSKYNIIEIRGHRSVSGLRISLYNPIPLESVKTLVQCMLAFRTQELEKK